MFTFFHHRRSARGFVINLRTCARRRGPNRVLAKTLQWRGDLATSRSAIPLSLTQERRQHGVRATSRSNDATKHDHRPSRARARAPMRRRARVRRSARAVDRRNPSGRSIARWKRAMCASTTAFERSWTRCAMREGFHASLNRVATRVEGSRARPWARERWAGRV